MLFNQFNLTSYDFARLGVMVLAIITCDDVLSVITGVLVVYVPFILSTLVGVWLIYSCRTMLQSPLLNLRSLRVLLSFKVSLLLHC